MKRRKSNDKINRFAPPDFKKIWLKMTLPVLAAVWFACYMGTGLFAGYLHAREAKGFDSAVLTYQMMFNRLNSHYASGEGEDGSGPMSYANYRKAAQFYLRYSGDAAVLYDFSTPEGRLVDSSEGKLFVNINWPDGTTDSLLSCDAKMDGAYYEFLDHYNDLKKNGRLFFRIEELYVNRDTWEFIPKKMYLSREFQETDDKTFVYENDWQGKEGFEPVTAQDAAIKVLFPGTVRNVKAEDQKTQDWYDARVASLDHLLSAVPEDVVKSMTVTYMSPSSGMLKNIWYYVSTLMADSRLESTIPVVLYDEAGNLNSYSLHQEYRYSIFREYGMKIALVWCGVTGLCLGLCGLISYVSYSRQKSRWEQEAYRRNLTNTLAHDLKSPLMAISGYAENLKEKVHPEKEAYYTDAIMECVGYMNDIVADMLELGSLEKAEEPPRREQVAAEKLFAELAEYYQAKMDAGKLKFSMTGTCVLDADPKLIRRAFDNLFNNAVNYTPEGNEIKVFLSPGQIVITNTGVSMTAEMCRKVFEPFVKEDRSRSGQKGNGLGLAIAKQIFDAHGMACRMESVGNSVSVIVDAEIRASKVFQP